MSFSGMLDGGGVSENTLRPDPSSHSHCAAALVQITVLAMANKILRQEKTGGVWNVIRAV
jgi:hypothetical protein